MRGRGKRVAILAGVMSLAVLGVTAWFSWPHLRFWWLFEPLGPNAQGYREYRHRQTGIVFVSLPGGKFWMGAQKGDPKGPNYDLKARPDEGPVHEVTLSPFLIGKYEVTQDQWHAVMGNYPSHFDGTKNEIGEPVDLPDDRDNLPVEMVSWENCQEFCETVGLRLPTEAQWEYACRAAATGPYAGTGKLEDIGWFGENSGYRTRPVGQKAADGFGLHDMQGNVWEWCEDVYDEGFYSTLDARGPDPVCRSGSDFRVFRGCSIAFRMLILRASRHAIPPGHSQHINGFRVVASPPP